MIVWGNVGIGIDGEIGDGLLSSGGSAKTMTYALVDSAVTKAVLLVGSDLLAQVSAVLFRHDPIGIAVGHNVDEYEPEAAEILDRLEGVRSVDEAVRVVHGVFVRWFSEDIAGDAGRFREVSVEVWEMVQRSRG